MIWDFGDWEHLIHARRVKCIPFSFLISFVWKLPVVCRSLDQSLVTPKARAYLKGDQSILILLGISSGMCIYLYSAAQLNH